MEYLPLSIRLKNRPCLLVGGGEVAARKIQQLIRAEANIHVVAPDVHPSIMDNSAVKVSQREFEASDLNNIFLVIIATNNSELNKSIAQQAKAANVLCNVADQSEQSDVIFSGLIDRDPITVAVSSAGKTPALLRLLRSQIQGLLPNYYSEVAELFSRYRFKVKKALPDRKAQRLFWKQIWHGKTVQLMHDKDWQSIESVTQQRLDNASQELSRNNKLLGSVALVGAGPGDPELLSMKAIRLIQWADVILYDRLVSKHILNYANEHAEMIYVGKRRDHHSVPQDSINELLIEHAQQGKQVVRLKGGDPFIFGRGGEEIDSLKVLGIRFEVVPGVSAGIGCAAYAGIPLTHREHANSVSFQPGYSKNGVCAIDWQSCLNPRQTLVIYMGLHSVEEICQQLIAHGRDPQTPIALIEQGTLLEQKVYTGDIQSFYQTMDWTNIQAPTLLIIGDVVKLHSNLNWFDHQSSL